MQGGNRVVKHSRWLIGLGLALAACSSAPPPPPAPPRSSTDMVEECQRLLKQGYSVGSVDNPRATYKVFGDLTTVEIAATYKAAPDARTDPIGYRCLFEKGKLFQAGAASF